MEQRNPLVEINLRAMEYIWKKVPKTLKDGVEYIVYSKQDIPGLYYSGLVDTQHFKLPQWEAAFKDCLGEDGQYWVNHQKMLFLGMFRYSKRVREPFDPLKLRTGKWPIEKWWAVNEKSLIPSTSLKPEFIKQKFDLVFRKKKSLREAFGADFKGAEDTLEEVLKKTGHEKDKGGEGFFAAPEGEYVIIEKQDLINMKNLIDQYPSPRRKLELSCLELRTGRLQGLANRALQQQKSTFEIGEDFRKKTKDDLKSMLVKASEDKTGGRKTTGEEINIKDQQKKRPRPTRF